MIANFIRHAKTEYNEKDLMCGITDILISEKGCTDTIRYKKENIYDPVDHCYISELIRTKETKDIIYPDISYTLIPDLNEMNLGIYEGVVLSPYMAYKNPLSDVLNHSNYDIRLAEGESLNMVLNRIDTAMTEIYHDSTEHAYNRIAIIGHGVYLTNLFMKYLPKEEVANGKIISGSRGIQVEMRMIEDHISCKFIKYI